jgi:hypothetical protein
MRITFCLFTSALVFWTILASLSFCLLLGATSMSMIRDFLFLGCLTTFLGFAIRCLVPEAAVEQYQKRAFPIYPIMLSLLYLVLLIIHGKFNQRKSNQRTRFILC